MRMKKIIGLALALVMVMGAMPIGTIKAYAAEDNVAIDETNFPDETFRDYIKKFDTDNDGKLSQKERNKVENIEIKTQGITDLKGIELFPNLWLLNCSGNNLTELNVSQNKSLSTLNCSGNQLKKLDVSHNDVLTSLYCSANKIEELDLSKNVALRNLSCYLNPLKGLNVEANENLEDLNCMGNDLTSLDVSKNKNLKKLDCSYNALKELDLKENTTLEELTCSSNNLTSLDVSHNKNLTNLQSNANPLKKLDVRNNTKLTELRCSSNELEELDVSQNTNLISLECYINSLRKLDVSNNAKLTEIKADQNPLTSLKLREKRYSKLEMNPVYKVFMPSGTSEIKFPEGFNASNIQDKTIKGIGINGDKLEWDEETTETGFKYKLYEDPEIIVDAKVIFREVENQALKDATTLVEAAEKDKTEENYSSAKTAVEALAKGSGKTGLE